MKRGLAKVWMGMCLALAIAGEPAWAETVQAVAVPPAVALPAELAPTGEYETRDLDWFDTTRDRAVPARLYLPKAEAGAPPVPLLVFSHGLGGTRQGYSYLGRYLAAHGVASLHVQHVGSDGSIWTGNLMLLAFRMQSAAMEREAMARVQDLHFALDQALAAPEWAGRLDANKVVVAGHSYGANTAMLAAGAQIWRDGKQLPLRDARFKAALLLSSPPFYGEGSPVSIVGKMSLPALHITTVEDEIKVPGYNSPPSDRIAVFEAMGSEHKALAVFERGSHGIFTDRIVAGGEALNQQVKQATQELALGFVQQVFGAQPVALASWHERYKPLLARFELR